LCQRSIFPVVVGDRAYSLSGNLLVPVGHHGHARQRLLAVTALTEHAQPPLAGMIPLTRNEIAGVAAALISQPAGDARHRLR
jgi:hypothetical protein